MFSADNRLVDPTFAPNVTKPVALLIPLTVNARAVELAEFTVLENVMFAPVKVTSAPKVTVSPYV